MSGVASLYTGRALFTSLILSNLGAYSNGRNSSFTLDGASVGFLCFGERVALCRWATSRKLKFKLGCALNRVKFCAKVLWPFPTCTIAGSLLHSSDVLAALQVLGCEADLSTLREYHQVRCQTVHLLPPNT